ncbi:MAG: hypothetical protein JRD05_10395 [Deltaproteobacteria bacterium]|nr:hypothetical protein [Deltaproteobacteria bacterium]
MKGLLEKMLRYNQIIYRLFAFFTALFILGTTFSTAIVFADDKSLDTGNDIKDEMIFITSDKLISDNEAGCAEFIGNVRAVQETTVITADKLKIYYNEGLNNNKNIVASEESIKKIVANGNVTIESDNRTMKTEHAVYTTATGTVVLSGANSKIIDGNNSISGSKITLFRDSGRIQVESGSDKRVEALIYSGKKGIK